MYFYFYQVFMIVSLVLSLFVIRLAWSRRSSPGAGAMIALSAASFVWTLGFYLEAVSGRLEQQLFFNNIGYLGSMAVPIAWFVFTLNYTNSRKLIRGWKTGFYCIFPLVIVILVWTNNLHHLMWFDAHLETTGSFLVTVKTYGPVFWIALVHNYFYIIIGIIVLIRRLFIKPHLYAGQAISLVIAVCLPLLWNIIGVFRLTSLPHKDLTPAMFVISAIAIALGLLRFRLFTAIPFAHEFVIQQLHDGVMAFDNDNMLVEANPVVLKTLGLEKSVIGKKLDGRLYPPNVFNYLSAAGFGCEEMMIMTAGEKRCYEIEKTKMLNYRGRQVGWMALYHDVTERKKMVEQLVMQDRLASIGQLTSGIAHELNNPLTSVINYSSLLMDREIAEDVKQDVSIIRDEARRMAEIVKSLLVFTRKQTLEKQPANVNDSIKKVIEFRAYEQKVNNIRVISNFNPELPLVSGNESQLQQVFFNLIINAEFVMLQTHRRGTLTVTTEKRGDYVRISLADDGPGISSENMKYLFTPFFTTKEAGKGTGLSLSICMGIITEHGGRIWAESEPGKGATFIIEIPVCE